MFYKVSFTSLEQAEALQKVLEEKHKELFQVVEESKTENSITTLFKIDPSLVRVINEIKNSDKLYKDISTEIVDGKPTNLANMEESKE